MANFDGYTPHPIERFTGLVEQDDVTNLPLGVAAVCRNFRFELTGGGTRYGVNQKLGNAALGLNMNTGFPVTGLGCFKYEGNGVAPDKTVPMLFDQNGSLMIEVPAGSGTLIPIASALITPGAGRYMQADQTLNRAYLAFTNLANPDGTSVNAVYDLNTGILDPLSMRPVGQTWAPGSAGTKYQVGEVVTPVLTSAGGNGQGIGKSFRASAITTGVPGNVEPAWPVADGGSVVDGGVTWTENTLIVFSAVTPPFSLRRTGGFFIPFLSAASPSSGFSLTWGKNAGAGAFAANRDVYVALTLVNANGETDTFTAPTIIGTALNDQLSVSVATPNGLRAWLTGSASPPTGWNLYVADVATGAAAPALAAYQKVGGGPFSLVAGTTINVNSTPATTPPPTVNTAILTAAGNVDAGSRWAIVLYLNRNGYISGMSQPLAVNSSDNPGGLQLQVQNIPTGPPNTAARILAFTVAGGTSAGPFAYIPGPDSVNGIAISSTMINDNVTTSGAFNFIDSYLTQLLATTANVSNFFDKVQLPALRSVTYSRTLDRMIYLPYLAPSGAYISLARDPETVLGSTGLFQCAETDGQNLMGMADWNGVIYGLKEASGHEVSPDSSNPSNWTSVRRWSGMGPCGLRAWAVGAHFIIFVHRSGVYAYFGDKPERISKDMPKTWKRVNWAAAKTIWVAVDDESHEIKVGVPLDRATVPSHTLSCNFEESKALDPPVHSTIYSRGKFISSAAARKWSVDDIPANQGLRVERAVLNAPITLDAATAQSQFWYASAFDSGVNAVTPDCYTDNGNLIATVNDGASPAEALKVSQLGGAQALITGLGNIGVTLLAGSSKATQDGGVNTRQTEVTLKDAIVKPGTTTDYKCGASGTNERWRLRFSTIGKTPGTWFRVMNATIFTRPIFQAKAN